MTHTDSQVAQAATRFTRATPDHLKQIMHWFPDARSCAIWGGPQFRFPFTETTFREDTHVDELASHVLIDAEGVVLAFGQYYLRAGRCHLGRLVVSPAARGQGLGRLLIDSLVDLGVARLGASECSLFVAPDNPLAIRLYEKLGFVRTRYPLDDFDASAFHYMVAPASGLGSS